VPLVLLSASWLPLRVIDCGALKAVASKLIVLAPCVEFAWVIAHRNVPVLPSSAVLLTVNVASSRRSSK